MRYLSARGARSWGEKGCGINLKMTQRLCKRLLVLLHPLSAKIRNDIKDCAFLWSKTSQLSAHFTVNTLKCGRFSSALGSNWICHRYIKFTESQEWKLCEKTWVRGRNLLTSDQHVAIFSLTCSDPRLKWSLGDKHTHTHTHSYTHTCLENLFRLSLWLFRKGQG